MRQLPTVQAEYRADSATHYQKYHHLEVLRRTLRPFAQHAIPTCQGTAPASGLGAVGRMVYAVEHLQGADDCQKGSADGV